MPVQHFTVGHGHSYRPIAGAIKDASAFGIPKATAAGFSGTMSAAREHAAIAKSAPASIVTPTRPAMFMVELINAARAQMRAARKALVLAEAAMLQFAVAA